MNFHILCYLFQISMFNLINGYNNSSINKERWNKLNIIQKISFILCILLLIIIIILVILSIIYLIKNCKDFFFIVKSEKEILIRKKKVYIFSKIILKEKFEEILIPKFGNICVICQSDLNKDSICITPCKHIFHYFCLQKMIYLNNTSNCPTCKFDFFNLLKDKDINYDKIKWNDFSFDIKIIKSDYISHLNSNPNKCINNISNLSHSNDLINSDNVNINFNKTDIKKIKTNNEKTTKYFNFEEEILSSGRKKVKIEEKIKEK